MRFSTNINSLNSEVKSGSLRVKKNLVCKAVISSGLDGFPVQNKLVSNFQFPDHLHLGPGSARFENQCRILGPQKEDDGDEVNIKLD